MQEARRDLLEGHTGNVWNAFRIRWEVGSLGFVDSPLLIDVQVGSTNAIEPSGGDVMKRSARSTLVC